MSVDEEKEFEERSDYIDDTSLELWNVENNHFDFIQKKLHGVGAKLLVGPRGTGKTHQMKLAHIKCLRENNKPISIFVSFSKYYHLEPFLTKVPNAIQIFHTWVLAKITLGCYNILEEMSTPDLTYSLNETSFSKEIVNEFVEKAEKLKASQLSDHELISILTIPKVIDIIENLTQQFSRTRAILMLDDAALSLTPDYLVEFFDIFSSLKTKNISPKASVYPGTTQYGPRFHVGQDAEMVKCWLSVEDDTYSSFMNSLIIKRFSSYVTGVANEILELFKYASFGVPRAFISLLRNYKSNDNKNAQAMFNSVVDLQAKFIETEYLSISQKLLQYKKVIDIGYQFFKKVCEEIKEDNKVLHSEKNIMIGIASDSITEIKLGDRMLRFLIEAGLLYEETPVRHGEIRPGEPREYKRYIPHLLFLIQNRTFSIGRGFSFNFTLQKIKKKSRKHPLRRSLNNILSKHQIDGLTLDLPPCQNCSTPRLNADQRFCHNCGHELINQSAFERCMKISVDDLPLTDWQKKNVKKIDLNTVGDFVALQDPGTELRKIHRVGVITSEKIYSQVEKIVDEYLA